MLGKKAQRREERIREAKRKNFLQRWIAMSVIILNAWMHPDESIDGIMYGSIDLTTKEKQFVKRQLAKVDFHRSDLIRRLGLKGMYYPGKKTEEEARCKAFFESVDKETIVPIEDGVRKYYADGSHTDHLRIITYVAYANLYDWWVMHDDDCHKDIRYLVQTLGTFCDRMLPEDSPLKQAMNSIYWESWNTIQCMDQNPWLETA